MMDPTVTSYKSAIQLTFALHVWYLRRNSVASSSTGGQVYGSSLSELIGELPGSHEQRVNISRIHPIVSGKFTGTALKAL